MLLKNVFVTNAYKMFLCIFFYLLTIYLLILLFIGVVVWLEDGLLVLE